MNGFLLAERAALEDAARLIAEFGEGAAHAAAARAEDSRSKDNVRRYCHWRQIERMIDHLGERQATGTIH